jgi:polyhydroxybutyrate depolymerase
MAALGAGVLVYLLWTPATPPPHLSGVLTRGAIEFAGLRRTYSLYTPANFEPHAPLIIALHGSDGSGGRLRIETGYGFERLADQYGFAVAYPNAVEGNWNACNRTGDFTANRLNIDDVGFLTALLDRLAAKLSLDRARVFAVGVSRGGQMAYRLALEAPERLSGAAAVAASIPRPENFKCRPARQATPSVLIMNGVEDPLNPFNGGEVQLYGLYRRGQVRSSRASGQYFADLNHIAGPPRVTELDFPDHVAVEDTSWRNTGPVEIELLAIHGGGHGIPQPYHRGPRLLGPSPSAPDGPALIWAFFQRQVRHETRQ